MNKRGIPEIRYVCLSDMHLGEEDSLLTNLKRGGTETDPGEPSPVAVQLVACLREVIPKDKSRKKPALILNGDILELALSETNEAAMAFQRFVELTMEAGRELFSRIIYVPGNHDHHLWESARETQYVQFIRTLKPREFLPPPWHTTSMFVEKTRHPVPCYFLTRLIKRYRHLKRAVVATAYPNLGLYRPGRQKCVVFHHGHFTEPMYQLMSTLRSVIFPDRGKPETVWDIEGENFAWIDFFWSTLGRSGRAGSDMELIYERMRDEGQLEKLLATLAENLARKYDLPGLGDVMESKMMKWIFRAVARNFVERERTQTARLLTEKAEEGLRSYLNTPLRNQALAEGRGVLLRDTTFIFGHTHKPFEQNMRFEAYPDGVKVYNTGGWVVETEKPEPLHGGAVVLLDQNLDAVSVRMYSESASPEKERVRVGVATRGDEETPLYDHVASLVDPSKEPWKTFSSVVAEEVRIRAMHLQARVHQED